MTREDAWLYAASWGSYMASGDAGACMYGFDAGFAVQSEEHRRRCLSWIDDHCIPMVQANPDREEYERDELEKLRELRAMIVAAPIKEG